jgi:hypothetical protein
MARFPTGIALAALVASGCASAFRAPTTPFPAGTPTVVPWNLNRELLAPSTKRILFVVDLNKGEPPEVRALDHLVAIASRYGERPARWAPAGMRGAPMVTRVNDALHFTRGSLDPSTSYVFVHYDGSGGHFGRSGVTFVNALNGTRQAYFINVYQENHRPLVFGWLTEEKLEMQTLLHEYGHLLGLPSLDHGFYADFPSFEGGSHCVNPDCPLVLPNIRSIIYNLFRVGLTFRFLDDYCDDCQRNIAAAKQRWRQVDAKPPSVTQSRT